MTTKLNDLKINPEFSDFFTFKTEEEKLEHDSQMISYRILSEIEKLCDERNIKKKDLADLVGTSRSYITQLFRGTKSINTYIMAKFENALDVNFEFCLKLKGESYNDFIGKQLDVNLFTDHRFSNSTHSFYLFHHDKQERQIAHKLNTEHKQKEIA